MLQVLLEDVGLGTDGPIAPDEGAVAVLRLRLVL